MTPPEEPFFFACEGERLLGIVSHAAATFPIGVLVIVGGPQYRVGSHRQFVLLARSLAESGVPTMRFDYRGMGDATGAPRTFEEIGADIDAALAEFRARVPGLEAIVLWGLCDAASAALFYAWSNPRVAGLVLLNPWIRTEQGIAKAYLRHYYARRLLDGTAWRRMLRGEGSVVASLGSAFGTLARALRRARDARPDADASLADAALKALPLPERMAAGLERFGRNVLIVLSGEDLTAKEFQQTIAGNAAWARALAANRVLTHELPAATHTFSSRAWRDEVAQVTRDWVVGVAGAALPAAPLSSRARPSNDHRQRHPSQ